MTLRNNGVARLTVIAAMLLVVVTVAVPIVVLIVRVLPRPVAADAAAVAADAAAVAADGAAVAADAAAIPTAALARSAGRLPVGFWPATWSAVRFSVGQGALSAAISVVLAIPVAFLLTNYWFFGRRFGRHLLRSITLLPFVLPSIIVVVALVSVYGTAGIINSILGTRLTGLYAYGGIILAHVYFNLALAVRIIAASWERLDPRLDEQSRSLGAGGFGTFVRVSLPLLVPAILTAALLVFLYSFFSFGIVLVFGGVAYRTLEVEIYRWMDVNLDPRSALVVAGVQMAITGLFTAAMALLIRKHQFTTPRPRMRTVKPLAGSAHAWWGYPLVVAVGSFSLGPLVGLVIRSLRAVSAGGSRPIAAVVRADVGEVVLTSIGLAAASGGLMFVGALALSLVLRAGHFGTTFDTLFQAPITISSLTLCLALSVSYSQFIRAPVLIVGAQVVLGLPFVFRSLRSAVAEIPNSISESAAVLGAGPIRRLLDIELPLIRRSLTNALAYAVAIAFADFSAVFTLGRSEVVTFPVAIYRLIGFRSFDSALRLAVVYIAICFLFFVIIDRTGDHDATYG